MCKSNAMQCKGPQEVDRGQIEVFSIRESRYFVEHMPNIFYIQQTFYYFELGTVLGAMIELKIVS